MRRRIYSRDRINADEKSRRRRRVGRGRIYVLVRRRSIDD